MLTRRSMAPSRELHADFCGKHGPPISWDMYRWRYLAEMRDQREAIATLATRVAAGEATTLFCSSACKDAERCHRTLLKELIESRKRMANRGGHEPGGGPRGRSSLLA